MPSIHLEFPVFVSIGYTSGGRVYRIRPLLAPEISGQAKKFDDALRACIKAVRKALKDYRTERSNLDRLLWYQLDPELQIQTLELELGLGQRRMPANVMAAWFDLDGLRYVCLPRFKSHLFIAAPLEGGRYAMPDEVQRGIDEYLREQRRETGSAEFDREALVAARGDFITTIEASVYVRGERFSFDPGPPIDERARAGLGAQRFDGAFELGRVGRDLNMLHPGGLKRALVDDPRVERLRELMYGRERRALALVGPPGAGKTTVLHAAIGGYIEAKRRARSGRKKTAAYTLRQTWHVDPNRVIAGMAIVGMWQSRFTAILEFLRTRLKRRYQIDAADALYIDNPVALARVGRSAQNAMTLSTVLRPYLEQRTLPIVLEATPEAWLRLQELDRAFTDPFQVIRFPAPPRQRALRIVARQRAEIERRSGCRFDARALARAAELADREVRSRVLPGSAVELLDQLATRAGARQVTAADVDAAFLAQSRLSPALAETREPLEEGTLRAYVAARLVGQPEASEALVRTLHAIRARLNDPEKPLASLLFCGPTGVGKTEAAKVLAGFMSPDPAFLVRFDMNEYVDPGAAARLIGDDLRPEGRLTGRVRYQPWCVLLFDEIEKAHPLVHDLLLQVLGEGRLTDAAGRVTDFSRAAVILTSNLGAREVGRRVGFDPDGGDPASTYRAAVRKAFRPEFVNRIDQIVAFRPLDPESIRQVARLQLARVVAREGFSRRTTFLNASDRVMDRIGAAGFDPEMGARALKRALERDLTGLAAEQLASLPPGLPVVIDVHAVGSQLQPRVTSLESAPSRPHPDRTQALSWTDPRELAESLDRQIEQLQAEAGDAPLRVWSSGPAGAIDRSEARSGDAALDAAKAAISERLQDLRIQLAAHLDDREEEEDLMFSPGAFSQRAQRRRPRKWRARRSSGWSTGFDLRYVLAQMDVRDYLRSYSLEWEREYRVDLIEVAIALCALRIQREAPLGRVGLHLRSLVDGAAGAEAAMDHLAAATWQLARRLNIEIPEPEPEQRGSGERRLVATGGGLETLLGPEAGVHLTFPPHGAPVAIALRLVPLAEGEDAGDAFDRDRAARDRWLSDLERGADPGSDPWAPGPIVRVYNPPGTGGTGLVLDARSGQISETFPARGHDQLRWLYCALPDALRLTDLEYDPPEDELDPESEDSE